MKYNINKDNYVRLLWNRPALIKKIVSLDEDTAAFFVKGARGCYEYLPYKLQASVKVVRAYIHETPEGKELLNREVKFSLIPLQALEQLNTKERIALIKRFHEGAMIKNFIEPCYNEWLEAVKMGFDPLSVPEKFHDRKTLYVAAAKYYYKENCTYPNFTIPDVFWQKNPKHANESLIEMLEICPRMIHCISPERITKRHLVAVFHKATHSDIGLSFNEDKWLRIPLSSWDTDTVEMALTVDPASIGIVPEKYLTESDALKCAKNDRVWEETIPESLHTRRVLVSLAATDMSFSTSSYKGLVTDLSFQLDVIKESGFYSAKALNNFIEPENYTKVLSICPKYIQLIPKLKQTDEIIDALLGAPANVIDNIAKHINLGKIKKCHAPLLIGCESLIILSTIEKKLKGRHTETKKKTSHSVEIDMAPGEFANIRNSLE